MLPVNRSPTNPVPPQKVIAPGACPGDATTAPTTGVAPDRSTGT